MATYVPLVWQVRASFSAGDDGKLGQMSLFAFSFLYYTIPLLADYYAWIACYVYMQACEPNP